MEETSGVYGLPKAPTGGKSGGDRKTRIGRARSTGEAHHLTEMVLNAFEREVGLQFQEPEGTSSN